MIYVGIDIAKEIHVAATVDSLLICKTLMINSFRRYTEAEIKP